MSANKLLLIGCGRHAFETIGPALAELGSIPDIVCDKDEVRAAAFAEAFASGAQVVTQWENYLSDGVGRVIVAVSPEVHARVAHACIGHSRVLIEKPPAASTAIAETLSVEAGRGSVFVGFNFRFAPAIKALHTIISTMAEVVYAEVRFWSRQPAMPEAGYRTVRESWVYGNAIHAADAILTLFGDPDDILAHSFEGANGLVGTTAHMRYGSKKLVTFAGGNTTPNFDFTVEVRDERGRMVKLIDLDRIVGTTGGRNGTSEERQLRTIWQTERTDAKTYHQRGHLSQFRAFLTLDAAGAAQMFDAVKAMRVCDAFVS
jgi:predicted dehydrogenase